MKKAFTLIELLAVIIILAIVALIATPIVLNVVDDAKNSAAKSEAAMIVSGVNNYCAASAMKEQLNGATNICKDGVTPEEVKLMVNLGNAKVNSITYELDETSNVVLAMANLGNARVKSGSATGRVTALEVESNGRTVKYNGSTYTIDGEVVDTPEEPVTPPAPTYAAYSVGDDVTLNDGTTWVVVKDSTTSESEIKIMSTSNVHPNLTNETGIAMFNGGTLAYSSPRSSTWDGSTLKAYLDSTVKTRIEESLGTSISDITIWGTEELTALGCTVTGGVTSINCDNTKPWYSKVFQTAQSWTKLYSYSNPIDVWYVNGIGKFEYVNCDFWTALGARPIITVSKSVISQ